MRVDSTVTPSRPQLYVVLQGRPRHVEKNPRDLAGEIFQEFGGDYRTAAFAVANVLNVRDAPLESKGGQGAYHLVRTEIMQAAAN
jgi:hypothetical protein